MPLNGFHKHNPSKPLRERQGNISLPCPAHTRTPYKPSPVTPGLVDDDTIPLTGPPSTPVSRQNSFTMKTLNPRRLSLRLKNRPQNPPSSPSSTSTSSEEPRSHQTPDHRSQTETQGGTGGRPEFVYKPICRTNYPAVVAETVAAQSRPGSRYQYHYIPSRRGDNMMPQSQSRSRAHAHAYAHYAAGYESGRNLYGDLDDDISYPLSRLEGGRTTGPSRAPRERAESYTSAAEKRRSRAARRLTTVMVPDAEDIYG
ncbi:uncharacterized protein BJX67DRAFT_345073 [Aspergillus lucknowensis]|uniref:Uncharacterized protein n=1 Tax=Aspergillus lucknowensis TaxID=176173 RepID=A0ABR4M0F9_9EURO